jgi:hypothetical protein
MLSGREEGLEKKLKGLGIGRFQIMSLLQAARYYVLKGDPVKAKSFGLNRAIFYAWAKYYGTRSPYARLSRIEELLRKQILSGKKTKCPEGFIEELGECVKISPRGYYVIGDQEQTPYDYDQQVTRKIARIINPETAWEKAIKYISRFPRKILENPQLFYKYVYEPIRDTFFIKLLRGEEIEPPKEIIDRIKSLEEMIEKSKKRQLSIDMFTEKMKGGKEKET